MKAYFEVDCSPSTGLVRIFNTKEKAKKEREAMKKEGWTNIQIKKKHRQSYLSDF